MTTYGDSVPVTQEGLNLFLIVDVPYAHDAVLAPRDHVLPVWRDSVASNLIEVTLHLPIKLLAPEDKFAL